MKIAFFANCKVTFKVIPSYFFQHFFEIAKEHFYNIRKKFVCTLNV